VFNTSERFPRRLIAERRIEFVRSRHVRIPERAIAAYVAAGTVDPLPTIRRHGQGRPMKRRSFGSIRRLPSGRYQARYEDPLTGQRGQRTTTFERKHDAETWLSRAETEISGGSWINPDAGLVRWPSSALADRRTRTSAPDCRTVSRLVPPPCSAWLGTFRLGDHASDRAFVAA